MASNGYDTVELIHRSMEVKHIPMEHAFVSDAIGEQYKEWHAKNPVFINSPTGSRKTTFVYDKLIPNAIHQGRTTLLVSNRIALSLQQKKKILSKVREFDPSSIQDISDEINVSELKDITFFGSVCVCTYQGLFSLLNHPPVGVDLFDWMERLQYAVFDEIHFLYSDATFNSLCGFLLYKIPIIFQKAVRVYMTATSWEIDDAIFNAEIGRSYTGYTPKLTFMERFIANLPQTTSIGYTLKRYFFVYYRKADYSQYRLHFFSESQFHPNIGSKTYAERKTRKGHLLSLYTTLSSNVADSKWLVFVDKKSTGKALLDILSNGDITSAYFDSHTKKPYSAWEKLISQNKIEQSVLISTPVIENGVNIEDSDLKNVAIMCIDRTSLIQLIGRKRLLDEDGIIDLWIWLPTKDDFKNMASNIEKDLKLASLLDLGHSQFRKTTEPYAHAVQTLWDSKNHISSPTLFYIGSNGMFYVSDYVRDILQRRLAFIQQFTRDDNLLSFKDVVEEWLGIPETLEVLSVTDIDTATNSLFDLLEKNANQSLAEDDFKFIRRAILTEAKKQNIKYIAPARAGKASTKTLNPILEQLGLPYTITKKAKLWTIHTRS